ncbi:hypothetical protein [Nocardia tengchongensis]
MKAQKIIEQYRGLRLDLADAVTVALAERLNHPPPRSGTHGTDRDVRPVDQHRPVRMLVRQVHNTRSPATSTEAAGDRHFMAGHPMWCAAPGRAWVGVGDTIIG